MIGQLYLVVFVQNPTKDEAEAGRISSLLGEKFVLGKTQIDAAMRAAREQPLAGDPDLQEVVVIPFVKSSAKSG